MNDSCYLGIDVGSISTNCVIISPDGEVLFEIYKRGEGSPIASVQQCLSILAEQMPESMRIKGVCTTGSGRILAGAVVGADVIKNEISAHARAALHLYPDVQTIFEIGGQDSKVTIIRDGAVVDFSMNLVCAAGTGSFLDSQARRLNITIEELSSRAVRSENPTNIAGRCTVFAESDMIHKQQIGHEQKDIMMGLCQALVRNYLSNVCNGKDIRPPVVFQGGVSANKGICRAFSEALKCDIIVPSYNMVMGAYGAALIASQSYIEQTKFRGIQVADHPIATRGFECGDCPNCCEIIEVLDDDNVIGRTGGRCGKWEGKTGPRELLRGKGPAGPLAPSSSDLETVCGPCSRVDDVPDLIQMCFPKK
ncbi:MAG: 2-hydroxyglutaryl-CoA dehydratase [Nitrospiraceae bacterium]|nr:MAG: 2-hydroxyglutaryl-CoA dehydratase [Nitrospiraceae bacterium]